MRWGLARTLSSPFQGNRQLSARYAALSLCRKKGLLGVVPEGVPPIQLVLPPTSLAGLSTRPIVGLTSGFVRRLVADPSEPSPTRRNQSPTLPNRFRLFRINHRPLRLVCDSSESIADSLRLRRFSLLLWWCVKRVIVTPAVYPRLIKSLCVDIQSTGQKSLRANTLWSHHEASFQLNSRIPRDGDSSSTIVELLPWQAREPIAGANASPKVTRLCCRLPLATLPLIPRCMGSAQISTL